MNSTLLSDFSRALDPCLIARDVGIELDDWQADLITTRPKRLLANCGRQVGKSTAAAICALDCTVYRAPSTVVLISPSLRQSVELFRTFHGYFNLLPSKPGLVVESLTRLEMENGSRVISFPGSEKTIRGIASVDLVIMDEAARVDDDLLAAVRPMLAVSDGALFALSTPAGKRGWFYEQWTRGTRWKRVSILSAECPRISKEFLEEERELLGPMLFEQEYCCVFHDDQTNAFMTEMIERAFVSTFPPFFPVDTMYDAA